MTKNLRSLETQDWEDFFEQVCLAEQILSEKNSLQRNQSDPGGSPAGAARRHEKSILGTIGMLTLLILLLLTGYGYSTGAGTFRLCLILVFSVIPVIIAAVTLTNWGLTRIISPRVLPKLDFKDGIAADCRTIVVIPALLSDTDEIDTLLRQVERHYPGNSEGSFSQDEVEKICGTALERLDRLQKTLNAMPASEERSHALFKMLNPVYHGDSPEKIARYRVEPYVIAVDLKSKGIQDLEVVYDLAVL